MRLVDLSPEWLTPDLFIFKNPTGGDWWLSCKRILMPSGEQHDLFEQCHPDRVIVASREDYAWAFEGNDFETLTVTPSIDASPAKQWHGHITAGQIV